MLQCKRKFSKSSASLILSGLCLVLSALSINASAQAAKATAAKQAADPVEISLERKKITVVAGKEGLVAAETVKPGEMLLETATYVNKSTSAVTKLEATLPIPPNTEFVSGSAQPLGAKASTDGKTFSAMPLKRKVTNAKGVVTETTVPLAEYRFLRWTVGSLAAGKSTVVSAKVKVALDTPVSK